MSSTTAFLVLTLLCFVAYASCKEPTLNGTKIVWNDDFDKDSGSEGAGLKTEYDAKGLQPWYDFANSFINTVLGKDPYGKFKSSYSFYFVSCNESAHELK